MLAATPATMEGATAGVRPMRDDRPVLEYGARLLSPDKRLPADLFSVSDLKTWCPRCFDGGLSETEVQGLEGAIDVVRRYYRSSAFLEHQPGRPQSFLMRPDAVAQAAIDQSLYLQQLVGAVPKGYIMAAGQFRVGRISAAVRTLEQLAEEEPDLVSAKLDLADLYLELGRVDEARNSLEAARVLAPNDRGVIAAWERLEPELTSVRE